MKRCSRAGAANSIDALRRPLTDKFAAIAEAQPALLARHWAGAGEAEPAISAWQKAGEAADARSALKEAEEDFRQALAMLTTLPESPERDARELAIVTVLRWVLQRTKGYSATETMEVVEQARALAEKTGNLPQLVLQVVATYTAVFVTGDYSGAAALADQLLDLAQREGGYMSLLFARHAQVMVRFNRGDLVGLEEHFARLRVLVEAYDREQFAEGLAVTIVYAVGFAGLGAWILGHVQEARDRIALAMGYARDHNSPFVLASGRSLEGYWYRWLREPQRAADVTAESVAISDEHGFSDYKAWPRIILGWARAQLGNPREGVALIRDGLAALAESGVRTDITNGLTILAEAQALNGAIDDALLTLNEALQANPEELWCRPNILKWRGELRLKIGQTEPGRGRLPRSHRTCTADEREDRGNCARRRAWRGCSTSRASVTKRARCSPKSITGSPRASTPPTSSTPRLCWRNCRRAPFWANSDRDTTHQ